MTCMSTEFHTILIGNSGPSNPLPRLTLVSAGLFIIAARSQPGDFLIYFSGKFVMSPEILIRRPSLVDCTSWWKRSAS